MFNRTKLMSLLVGVLLMLTLVPSALAQFTPAIASDDQDVVDGTVVVKMAIANAASWVVIHADEDGSPGPVIGQTAIPEGASKDVVVTIDSEGLTDVLHAMLHDDTGVIGEYEFPTADPPTKIGTTVVMKPFNVTGEATSLIGTAQAAGNFNTLLAAVEAAGLTSTLTQEKGPLTLFAPTDEAFAKIPQATLDSLLADTDALTKLLTYHVVPKAVLSSDITDGMTAPTIEGEEVTFSVDGATVKVNDATITAVDTEASNGVIHVIDTVIMPPSMVAMSAAEMTDTAAMTATESMTHTEMMTATESMDHSEMMTATESMTQTEMLSDTTAADAGGMDIVDTLVEGEFNTLITAAQAAELVEAWKGEGPFTVFAPTNEAFAKIPAETLNALLADPKGDLTQILLYHVVPGTVLSTGITDGMEVETLQGTSVKFTVEDGGVMVNDAKIVAVDIPTTNGVIHVIDTVLMPATEGQAAAAKAPASGDTSAPTQMPATGGSTNTLVTLLIVGLVLAGLAGSTVLNRRRTA